MKRKIALIASMVLIVSMLSLGTLAYFTDSEDARNVITAGNVAITLHDEDGNREPFPTGGVAGVMPGDEVDKVVYVTNSGDNTAYVRVRLHKSIAAGPGINKTLNFDNITLNIDLVNWTKDGDWYYYKHALAAGASTPELFTEVSYGTALNNDYMNAKVTIDVIAEAVQSANNGSSATTAGGWPTSP